MDLGGIGINTAGLGPALHSLMVGGGVFLGTLVFLAIAYGLYLVTRYNRLAMVYEVVGDAYFCTMRKVYLKRTIGTTEAFLFKFGSKGEKFLPPADDQWYLGLGGKKMCNLVRDDNNYKPMRIRRSEQGNFFLAADDFDAAMFNNLKQKEIREKYKNADLLKQWMPVIALGFGIVVLVLVLYFWNDSAKEYANQMGQSAATIAQAIKAINAPSIPGG